MEPVNKFTTARIYRDPHSVMYDKRIACFKRVKRIKVYNMEDVLYVDLFDHIKLIISDTEIEVYNSARNRK